MPRSGFESRKNSGNPNPKRNDPKKKSFRKRSADAPTFDACSPALVHALVCLCTTYNASPTFSYTRDGTSLVVAVYFEGERYVDYLNGQADLEEYLGWLVYELLEVDDLTLKPYLSIVPKMP